MVVNLKSLFEMQKALDYRIEQEHPVKEDEDRLSKKTLALQVELGELANELPQIFKFWSNKKNDYKKALGEYVDVLHFMLSIGNGIKGFDYRTVEKFMVFGTYPNRRETLVFQKLFSETSQMANDKENALGYYLNAFQWLLELGYMLGFTWEQIEIAYIKKNEVNHVRQTNKY